MNNSTAPRGSTGTGIAWPGLIVLLGSICAYWLAQNELTTSRPAAPKTFEVPEPAGPRAVHAVYSRMWEDPISATFADWEKRRSRQPSAKSAAARVIEVLQGPSSEPKQFTQAQEWFRDLVDETGQMDTVCLPILVGGGPYAEDKETRLRTRYAVVTALAHAGYQLEYPERMSYAVVDTEVRVLRDRRRETFVIPVKLYRQAGARNQILVLWINESQLGHRPMLALHRITDALFGGVDPEKKKLTYRIIGPSSSDGLQAIYKELSWFYDPKRSEQVEKYDERCEEWKQNSGGLLQSAHSPIPILSPRATASFALDAKWDPKRKSQHSCVPNFEIVRTIGDDHFLVRHALFRELRSRGAWPEPEKKEVIVLLTEHDTSYGHGIVKEFQQVFQNPEDPHYKFSSTQHPLRVLKYLRGIDGQTAGEQAENLPAKSKVSDSADVYGLPTEGTATRPPQGKSQYDYLRRLRKEIKELENDYHVTAIGVVGSDVYDKLLILRALRPHFSQTVFFTTDLDAIFTHQDELHHTRNLIIASHYDLLLDRSFRDLLTGDKDSRIGMLPFRDSYQTAEHLTTRIAVDGPYINNALRTLMLKGYRKTPQEHENRLRELLTKQQGEEIQAYELAQHLWDYSHLHELKHDQKPSPDSPPPSGQNQAPPRLSEADLRKLQPVITVVGNYGFRRLQIPPATVQNQPEQNQPGQNQPAQNQQEQNRQGQNRQGQNRQGQNRQAQNRQAQNQPGPNQPGQNQPGQNRQAQNRQAQNQPGPNQQGPNQPDSDQQNEEVVLQPRQTTNFQSFRAPWVLLLVAIGCVALLAKENQHYIQQALGLKPFPESANGKPSDSADRQQLLSELELQKTLNAESSFMELTTDDCDWVHGAVKWFFYGTVILGTGLFALLLYACFIDGLEGFRLDGTSVGPRIAMNLAIGLCAAAALLYYVYRVLQQRRQWGHRTHPSLRESVLIDKICDEKYTAYSELKELNCARIWKVSAIWIVGCLWCFGVLFYSGWFEFVTFFTIPVTALFVALAKPLLARMNAKRSPTEPQKVQTLPETQSAQPAQMLQTPPELAEPPADQTLPAPQTPPARQESETPRDSGRWARFWRTLDFTGGSLDRTKIVLIIGSAIGLGLMLAAQILLYYGVLPARWNTSLFVYSGWSPHFTSRGAFSRSLDLLSMLFCLSMLIGLLVTVLYGQHWCRNFARLTAKWLDQREGLLQTTDGDGRVESLILIGEATAVTAEYTPWLLGFMLAVVVVYHPLTSPVPIPGGLLVFLSLAIVVLVASTTYLRYVIQHYRRSVLEALRSELFHVQRTALADTKATQEPPKPSSGKGAGTTPPTTSPPATRPAATNAAQDQPAGNRPMTDSDTTDNPSEKTST